MLEILLMFSLALNTLLTTHCAKAAHDYYLSFRMAFFSRLNFAIAVTSSMKMQRYKNRKCVEKRIVYVREIPQINGVQQNT